MLGRFHRDQHGGVVMEAALLLPFFLTFVVGIILFIQIAIMELALQAGVSETAKSIAGQLYPVRLLAQETKSRLGQSQAGEWIYEAIDRVQAARNKVIGVEDLADEYAAYIPDWLLEVMKWEKTKRLDGEDIAQEEIDKLYDSTIKPQINAAFTSIAYSFCDHSTIKKQSFKVISVTLPSMEDGENAFFGLEAQVAYKLPLPFMSRTIVLKKKAMERAWVGA